jgi:hypothetical protein
VSSAVIKESIVLADAVEPLTSTPARLRGGGFTRAGGGPYLDPGKICMFLDQVRWSGRWSAMTDRLVTKLGDGTKPYGDGPARSGTSRVALRGDA